MKQATNRAYWLFFTLVALVLVFPITIVEIPPLVDLPNHAARVHILANYSSTPAYRETFEVAFSAVPNIILDLIVVPLTKEIGIWVAIKTFLIFTVLIFLIGCDLIGNARHLGLSVSPLIASFFVYSSTFFYGYLNYVFSVSLFLVTFGLWLRWRHEPSIPRLLILSFLTVLVYLSHLSSFGFLFLGVTCVFVVDCLSSSSRLSWRFIVFDGIIFLLPCLMFFSYLGGGGSWRDIRWDGITSKLIALGGVFRSYDLASDVVFLILFSVCIVWLSFCKSFEIDRPVFYVAVVFFIIFIPSPSVFITGDADVRIVLPAFVLLICSLRIPLATILNFRHSIAIGIFLSALLCSRQALISYNWSQMSKELVTISKLFKVLPPHSRIYPLYGRGVEENMGKQERPMLSVLSLATIDHGAIPPTLFAFRGQNPLIFRTEPAYASLSHINERQWLALISVYDYVWTYQIDAESTEELSQRADLVVREGKAAIWKIKSQL